MNNLKKYKIFLASGSPRRQELLKGLDIDFEVYVKKDIDEDFPEDMDSLIIPVFLAEKKASVYADMLVGNQLIITADTIVSIDNHVLNKPGSVEEAIAMLQKLSGNKHTVITGVCIKTKDKSISFSATTDVWFCPLSDEEIQNYVANYKPFDKAGAYGIQEWLGYAGIERIEGSYFNVMGLPSHRLYEELKKF